MAKSVTMERAEEKRGRSEGEYSALQDWVSNLGPTWDTVLVSVAMSMGIMAIMFVLDVLFWHSLF